MSRTWAVGVLAAGVVALGLVGLGRWSTDEEAPGTEASRAGVPAQGFAGEDPRVAGILSAYLPGLEHPDPAQRRAALIGLRRGLLEGKGKQLVLKPGAQEVLARSLIRVYGRASDASRESLEARRGSLGLICARVDVPSSRNFVLGVLTDGGDEMRAEALRSLGSPKGPRGPELDARLRALIAEGRLGSLLPRALVALKGPRAKPELTEIVKTSTDAALFQAAAVELQSFRDQKAMIPVLARMGELGFLEPDADTSWIDGKLLAKRLDAAQGEETLKALAVVEADPMLTADCLPGLRRRLDDEDVRVRKAAATLLGEAVLAENLEPHAAERLLTARLERETEPDVIQSMNGDLARVREEKAALESGVGQK